MPDFIVKLWERRIVQFAVLYLGIAWLILQVTAQLEETLELPNWLDQTVVAILALGFPLVLVFAWVRDRMAPSDDADAPIAAETGGAHAQEVGTAIAVLPFDNLSTDEEMQFFSDGVSEEILGRLARGSDLKVIGRASSFRFRGDEKPKAAKALKATHVLDGSIRRAGARVRVAAHLVETKHETTLWSERYDRDLEDIFAVQDDIADAIANALHQTLDLSSTDTIDPGLYDLYLRASPRTYVPEDVRMRVDLLETVTQQAPKFAAAWGRLAYVRSVLRLYEPYVTRPESGARIAKEAERALALDPENVDALAAKYWAIQAFGEFEEGEGIAEKIIDTPGLAEAKFCVGFHLVCAGRARAAAEYNKRLYDNDPFNLILAHRYASSLMTVGSYDNAIAIFREVLAREPGLGLAQTALVRAHAFNKNWAAVDALMNDDNPIQYFDSAEFVRTQRSPTPDRIEQFRKGLFDYFERTGCTDAARLVQAAHLGLVDEAFEIAETARLGPPGTNEDIADPDAYRTAVMFHAGMPELREDPRFVKLCAKLGLVALWRASNKWPDCADEVHYDFRSECEAARDIPTQPFFV